MHGTVLTEFKRAVTQFNHSPALFYKGKDKQYTSLSYSQVYALVSQFGAGLSSIGASRGEHIGILSDNRKEWFIGSLGIMGIGAADVPRGSDSTPEEFRYILNHTECRITLTENEAQLEKIISLKKELKKLKIIIVMDEEYIKESDKKEGFILYTFSEILSKGEEALKKDPECFEKMVREGKEEDLATVIYTSGTTGEPKGVMLSHANFLHQIRAPVKDHLRIGPTDVGLSVLPVWHSFERSAEYALLFAGCSLAYSKPVARVLMADMEEIRPTILPSVPRIWEAVRTGIYKKMKTEGGLKALLFHFFIGVGSLYSKLLTLFLGLKPQFKKRVHFLDALMALIPLILLFPLQLLGQLLVFGKLKKKLGGRFRFGISGAGGLPPHVDAFFSAVGIMVLEGYGLTEAAPIISVREERRPIPETIGPVLPEIEFKILDKDTGEVLPPGKKGILYIKGPNVMKGYYKRPEETAKVLSEDGWLNTGDLVMATYNGELKHMGREKETIALMGGENVEPCPLEEAILMSDLIEQVMVVGHDQKYLGALVVPNLENLKALAASRGINTADEEELLDSEEVFELIADELNSLVNTKKGFKAFERIFKFAILKETFKPGVELTHSLKLKRNVIEEIYSKEISGLFN